MGTYQIVHKYQWHLQECRNVFYYQTTVGEPSDSEFQDMCDEIRADFVAQWAVRAANTLRFSGIDHRRVDSAGLLSFSKVPTAGTKDGDSAVDSVASQVALLVSVKGVTTKPNRARTYLPGAVEDDMVNSLWISAAKGVAETYIDLQSALNSGGTNPLTRVAAQWSTGGTFVVAINDISGQPAVASDVPATQRRRRIGVGI